MSNWYLAIRTDQPEAEIYLYKDSSQIDKVNWLAHRELSVSLIGKIDGLLKINQLTTQDLSGVIAYQGPGSFTGLRIGLTVANSLAYSLEIPAIGATRDDWLETGLAKMPHQTEGLSIILPAYGAPPHITQPKK